MGTKTENSVGRPHVVILIALLAGMAIIASAGLTFASVVKSKPDASFNITSDLWINWTNLIDGRYGVNMTIGVNHSYTGDFLIQVLNDTSTYEDSALNQNYSQGNTPGSVCEDMPLLVRLENGTYSEGIGSMNPASDDSTDISLIFYNPQCKPGRYYTDRFTLKNATGGGNANATIYLDIPISTSNTLSNSTMSGSFTGSIPINHSSYHSYYFNATSAQNMTGGISNATGVMINLSAARDLDIFLFDNIGELIALSNSKTASDSMRFNYLPFSASMWEVRISGNHTSATSYTGRIFFTTLNITNETDDRVDSVDFGTLNISGNASKNLILENTNNVSISGLRETVELYYVKRFTGLGTGNHTFMVPGTGVSKVEAIMNWNGSSNYSFNMYKPGETLVGSSLGRHGFSNVSKAMKQEENYTTDISTTSKHWRIEVTANTPSTDNYALTVKIHVSDTSEWISSNFSGSVNLNRTGHPNSQKLINVSLTGRTSALDGNYEGKLKYLDRNNVGIEVPIGFTVKVPVLAVNDTLNSDTYVVNENYGENLARTVYFNISNLGTYAMSLNFTDTGKLSCSPSCSGYNASLSYNTTATVPANSFSIIEVTTSFNRSMPMQTLYSGWIKINATNNDISLTSRPYTMFTLNVKLNLTNQMHLVLSTRSNNGTYVVNSSRNENATLMLDAWYMNRSSKATNMVLTNITSVWLQETNVTGSSGRIPVTGNFTLYKGTDPVYCTASCPSWGAGSWGGTGHHFVNFTIPSGSAGGMYRTYANISYISGGQAFNYTLSGLGVSVWNSTNQPLFIDNAGLKMTAMNSTTLSLAANASYVFAVNVSNYGPRKSSSASIRFSEGCGGYRILTTAGSYGFNACAGSYDTGSNKFTFTTPIAAHNTSCVVFWTIKAGTSAASACTANIIADDANWFDSYAVNLSITITGNVDGGVTVPPLSPSAPSTTTYSASLQFTQAESFLYLVQNSSNTTLVEVKNNGNVSQAVTFTIESIDSSWWSSDQLSATLASGSKGKFLVTFDVGNVKVGDYAGKFKASSPNTTITSDFTLRILPSAASIIEINDTILIYKNQLAQLLEDINNANAAGINVSTAVEKYDLLKAKIDQADALLKAGKYFEAFTLYDEIETLIADAQAALEAAREEATAGQLDIPWTTVIIVAVIVAAVLVFGYLFWPSESAYQPGKKKYMYREKTPRAEHSQMFRRGAGAMPSKFKSLIEKIKNIFRRRRREERDEIEIRV